MERWAEEFISSLTPCGLVIAQVFLVRKRTGADSGKICAMKVLRKVSWCVVFSDCPWVLTNSLLVVKLFLE